MCYTGTEQYVNIFATYTVYYINIEVLTYQAVLYSWSEVGFVKKKEFLKVVILTITQK